MCSKFARQWGGQEVTSCFGVWPAKWKPGASLQWGAFSTPSSSTSPLSVGHSEERWRLLDAASGVRWMAGARHDGTGACTSTMGASPTPNSSTSPFGGGRFLMSEVPLSCHAVERWGVEAGPPAGEPEEADLEARI